MKRYFLMAALGLLIATFFNSCYNDKEDYLYPERGINCDTTNVAYGLTIKPIFDNNCIGCHGSGTTFNFDGHAPLSGYLANNAQKLLDNINYVSNQYMPPSNKLNDCYLNQIRIWIQAGYPNN
jgi:mono/diheme cytochrome c family protein